MSIKIGLTGGIGSGKSKAAEMFAHYGVPIIDADVIAREVVTHDSTVLTKIREKFGEQVLLPSGELNRKRLRELVFHDQQHRLWLETLLHPLIRERLKQLVEQVKAPYCIIVIPLLAETDQYEWLDRVLVIDADEKTQINRVKQRDQMTEQTVMQMMKAQATREKRLAIADDVIENNTTLADLQTEIQKLHTFYSHLNDES